ncbi:tetratricopeptide repeat protein [Sphaerisporangium sp. TRM90804]|uniref:tetratricopeptide repeat protein n=1 Tax=Sphaerisporangium sp. TRM90804 TaxID=3031113 RepID=UPI002447A75E|nr:tetratricopeptide repeat protein [Sphaerisporangium sp. TRM90804]MDH2424915.1 tetratricopeptide repeat protein [Sphaerisporangium sp. TRM90804]
MGVDNEISGTVYGPAVQARSIHGDVQINVGTHVPAPVPAQLGPVPAVFINREEELARLDRYFRAKGDPPDSPFLVVITGVGGVGKSSLALKWLHRLRPHFADGQLYADLRASAAGVPPAAGEVVGRFLRALGVPPERVPVALDEQVTMFRSVTAGRRLLLMLDNAASAAQVRAVLPPSADSLVLATSRRRLAGLVVEGARYVALEPLTPAAAVGVLDRVLGPERTRAEPEAALELVRLCGRLPIAVCASAARLALRPRWSLDRLVRELADASRRLATLSADDDVSPQAAFDVSYMVLAEDEARLYRRLGLHPGATFGPGAAAAAGGVGEGEASRILEELVAANLLEAGDDDLFRFHDLLHLHARGKALALDPPEERGETCARIAGWYLRAAVAADLVVVPGRWHLGPAYEAADGAAPAFGGPAEALDRLEDLLPVLRAIVAQTHEYGLHELTWQTCEALWGLFLNRKHYGAWVETHRTGLASARACGDLRAESRMLLALATAHLNLRDFEVAADLCQRAADIERSGGHALDEAAALSTMGVAYLGMRRPERAAERFRRAREIHERLGRRRGVALMTRRLGEAHRDMGLHDAAVAYLSEARELFAALPDGYNEARTLTGLGQTHLLAGRPEEARTALLTALILVDALGAEYERANVRVSLAEALAATGDHAGARGHLVTAVEIFDRLAAPEAESARHRLAALPGDTPPAP